MPIVNYVREHTRFIEYATDENLTSGERLLWYALMHIMNMHAQGNVWPEDFIRINNDRLLSYCPMKYDTLLKARNSLKQRGRIEFIKGDKNKASPAYRMVYFQPMDAERDGAESIPNNPGNNGVYTGGNAGVYAGDNNGVYTGDFILNDKERDRNRNVQEDDEELSRGRAEAREAWKTHFGAIPTPAMVERLALFRGGPRGFCEGVIDMAVQFAALRSAEDPFAYVLSTLSDWTGKGVRTVSEAEEYAALHDMMMQAERGNGRMTTGEVQKRIDRFVEERSREKA